MERESVTITAEKDQLHFVIVSVSFFFFSVHLTAVSSRFGDMLPPICSEYDLIRWKILT